MDLGSIGDLREMLFSLPMTQVIITVFLVACAIGGLCTVAGMAIRATPEAVRDIRAWLFFRKATIQGQAAWIEGHSRIQQGRK
jgi:hypothetical protein